MKETNTLSSKLIIDLKNQMESLPKKIVEFGEKIAYSSLQDTFSKLQKHHKTIKESESNLKHFEVIFEKEIIKLINQSFFGWYLYQSSLKNIGRFGLLEFIWASKDQEINSKYHGTTKVGKYLNAFFLNNDLANALDTYIKVIQNQIIQTNNQKIASFGVNTGIEIEEAIKKNPDIKKEIHIFDQDPKAIEHIKNKLNSYNKNITYHQGNIIKALLNNKTPNFDLIYTNNLFQTLKNESAKKLIKYLWDKIEANGSLIITSATSLNNTQIFLEHISRVQTNYQTKESLISIAKSLANVKKATYTIDSIKLYQYLKLDKE
jgi:hypothetical protein